MNTITEAIKVLREGGIVIYPTDTAFGIGCRVDNEESVNKVFSIRNRPQEKAVPVLVSSIDMAKKYWSSPLPDIVRHLTEKYWPGGLTVIYTVKKDGVSPFVTGGKKTIGLRMPDHETPIQLIEGIGVPILGPSANFSGGNTPYSVEELDKNLIKKVDYVLEGKTKGKMASTVIDCTQTPPKIIRPGAVVVKMEEKITLCIDTSSNKKTIVELKIGKEVVKKENTLIPASQNLLPLIDEILKENNLTPHDLTEISVHTGPGSFTGLRVGVSIANTLATELHIPINGKKNEIASISY